MPHLPGLLRPEPMSPWQATADLCICRRYSNTQSRSGSDSVGSLGPGVHKVLFEPSKHLWWVWVLILNTILPLLPFCWGFSFALGCGVSFLVGFNILLLMVFHQLAAILEFSQQKMSHNFFIQKSNDIRRESGTLQMKEEHRVVKTWVINYFSSFEF